MKHWKLAGSTAMVTILAGTGAFADVTPEEVWQNWQDMSASYGQTVTAESAERDGDTLTATNVAISYDKDGVKVAGSIAELNFTDNGDGTVEVTMSETYPITVTTPAAEGVEGATPTDVKITLTQPDMVITASGSADALSYEFEAPTMTAKLESINGVDAAVIDITAEVALTKMSGSYLVEGSDEAKKVTSDFAAESAKLTVVGADKEKQSDINLTASIADIAGNSNGNFLGAAAMTDLAAALKAGFAVSGGFSHGATTFDLSVTEPDNSTNITGTVDSDISGSSTLDLSTTETDQSSNTTGSVDSDVSTTSKLDLSVTAGGGKTTKVSGNSAGGDVSFAMDSTHFQYGVGGKALDLTIASADLPFPEVKLGYQEAAFNMLMPVGKTDEPADFALLTKLVGFSVSDEVWGMIDPTNALPHDPATLIIDTKGKAKLTSEIFNEAEMAALGETPPGELHALDITEVKASVAGAELTGAGAFTFDNTDLATFGGMPAPTGKLDLKLVGGNGLLAKLVTMGMLTQDDASGFQMMASMFANTAADKDEMTSSIEFKDKGLYANGQKLQ